MTFVRTYDSATAPRGMLRHVLPMFSYPGLAWRNRYMIHNFFRRELMSRFHGSFLGVYWLLAQPLFLFTVYYFVFGILFGQRGTDDAPDPVFAIYLFSGVIVFHALVEATNKSVGLITANSNLVKKVAFPSETLILPTAMTSLVLYAVGAVVCLILGTVFGVLKPGWMLLTIPLLLVVQFTFIVGFGLLLANLNVFIRDIGQLWRILSMAWMFLTPIFWTPDRLDKLTGTDLEWVGVMAQHGNPLYSLVMCHRIALGGTDPMLGEFWPQFGVFTLWTAFFMVVGYSSFMSKKHKFADLV